MSDDSLIRQELELLRNKINELTRKVRQLEKINQDEKEAWIDPITGEKNMETGKIKTSDELIKECNTKEAEMKAMKARTENIKILRDKAKGEAQDSESRDTEELGL